jgi:hypothetical protein
MGLRRLQVTLGPTVTDLPGVVNTHKPFFQQSTKPASADGRLWGRMRWHDDRYIAGAVLVLYENRAPRLRRWKCCHPLAGGRSSASLDFGTRVRLRMSCGGHLKMPLVSGQRRRMLASQRHDLGLMGLDITAVIYSPAHLEGQCSVSPPSGRG